MPTNNAGGAFLLLTKLEALTDKSQSCYPAWYTYIIKRNCLSRCVTCSKTQGNKERC